MRKAGWPTSNQMLTVELKHPLLPVNTPAMATPWARASEMVTAPLPKFRILSIPRCSGNKWRLMT